MTDDDEDEIEPTISEVGFYKTVNKMIEVAYTDYHLYLGEPYSWGEYYDQARASLMAIYDAVILPHVTSHGEDKEVMDFVNKWGDLNNKYGHDFERLTHLTSTRKQELRQEYIERFTAVMTFLNVLGVTQLKRRGETWEDAELDVMMEELR